MVLTLHGIQFAFASITTLLDATTGDKIQTLFKVICGEAPLEDATEFLADSDQAKEYLIESYYF